MYAYCFLDWLFRPFLRRVRHTTDDRSLDGARIKCLSKSSSHTQTGEKEVINDFERKKSWLSPYVNSVNSNCNSINSKCNWTCLSLRTWSPSWSPRWLSVFWFVPFVRFSRHVHSNAGGRRRAYRVAWPWLRLSLLSWVRSNCKADLSQKCFSVRFAMRVKSLQDLWVYACSQSLA